MPDKQDKITLDDLEFQSPHGTKILLTDINKLMVEYAELKTKRKKIESELDDVKAYIRNIEDSLIDHFVENEMTSIKLHGFTLYMTTQLWIKYKGGITKEDAIEYLDSVDLSAMAPRGTNSSTLSAFAREQKKNDEPLPENWDKFFEDSIKTNIKVRSS